MNIILGSGPASVACAYGLISQGKQVLMIDPGQTVEQERRAVIDKASKLSKQEWSEDLYSLLRENTSPNVKGVPKKLVYGSDFPFRWLEPDVTVIQKGVDTLMSHALGGLSNAWGANVLPLLTMDTDTWPISVNALYPYYEKIASLIPIAAERDALEELFPLFTSPNPLPQSRQVKALLHDISQNQQLLESQKIYAGRSRLAVHASKCLACGLCLYGCPHALIYSSAQSVHELLQSSLFQYRPGLLAKRIGESNGKAFVEVVSIVSSIKETLYADKIFVGCGAVNSTALLLRSFGRFDEPLFLKDSQYFLTPFLRYEGVKNIVDEELHTLSQVALEILDHSFCDRSVHILFYTYNDMYNRALQNLLGPLSKLSSPILNQFLGRLLILQGYLHSDYSGAVSVTLQKNSGGESLFLEARDNPKTKVLVKKVLKKLISLRKSLRGIPLSFMNHIGEPGKSYHLGGSMPMSLSPEGFQSDVLGRVGGLSKVHVIDASIFPNVPATNITFTAMANAYRIGAEN